MYVLYYKKSLHVISSSLNIFPESKGKLGCDERFAINETANDGIQLYNIYQNLEKKKLLDKLQSSNISIIQKLYLLEDNSIKPPDIKAGGLMDDFF
jgi:hypothetical protein